ncbi:hypothetical protein D9619_011532 [Psilocybe cf. subviscida]|uniref:Uncharacterized protein n=1 Tax=Psilocybe cf. subviscida TaxID=2480587 RepID=A0A8H5F9E0_9AGAR|nr:hypothetical protein D9619_011532 [Psilocybe cf. subviscida]
MQACGIIHVCMPSYRQTLTKRFLRRTSDSVNTAAPSSSAQKSEAPQINVDDNASGAVSPGLPSPDGVPCVLESPPSGRSLSKISTMDIIACLPQLGECRHINAAPLELDFKKDQSPPQPGVIERRTAMTAELIRRGRKDR